MMFMIGINVEITNPPHTKKAQKDAKTKGKGKLMIEILLSSLVDSSLR